MCFTYVLYSTVLYCIVAYISFGCIYCNFLVSWVVAFLEPGQFTFKLIWAGWAYTLTALQSLISKPNHYPLPFSTLSPCVIQSFLFILYNHNLSSLSLTYSTHPFFLVVYKHTSMLSTLSNLFSYTVNYTNATFPPYLIHLKPSLRQTQPFLLII